MNMGLENKCVLITGACQGIGLATAEVFLQEGCYVCITSRNMSKLQKTRAYLEEKYSKEKIKIFCGNATLEKDIFQLLEMIEKDWKRLDILIPNIGSGKPLTGNPLATDEWCRLFELNIFGGLRLIEQAHELLKKFQGSIVMVSSIVAKQVWGSSYAYAASKNSIITLVKYLARDMAKDGIRVNCVLPGNVLFKGGRWEELLHNKSETEIESIVEAVPMKRFGKPEEIASGILFLASEKASFITGSCLTIDGGQTSIIG